MAGIAGLLNQLQSAFDTTNQQLTQSLDRIRLLEEQARQTSQPSIGGSVPATPGPADGSAQPDFSAEPGVPPGLGQIEGGFDNRVPISTMPCISLSMFIPILLSKSILVRSLHASTMEPVS